ncbi:MAG: winged helix-turn-helix domain-containing protein [Nitrososphaerota archaeon]|nr:hypothetical protein [Candidatus Bathyarchaeota archaeon]MDW8049019.1 winged helix-turn-helix domain-containing protein [Nitrososphaerota archaeon]
MWKRSKLEMYLDVLEVISSGVNKPTNIMYRCNLSWIPLKEILQSMVGRGLIREIRMGNKRIYEVTERGLDLLKYFKNVEIMLAVSK